MPGSAERPSLAYRLRARAIPAALRAWERTGARPVARAFHYQLINRTRNFATTSWLGTPIWQNVLDLWAIQEAIAEIRPALLIETGTHKGGSALFYASLMDLLGEGRIVTIDIVAPERLEHPRVEFLHGSSTDPGVVDRVREAAENADGPVMVVLDGNHHRDHVARELELYAPLVTPGSVLVSQDGIIDELALFRSSRPGPKGANRRFLDTHPEFSYDAGLGERFGITHHPLGWLRRSR